MVFKISATIIILFVTYAYIFPAELATNANFLLSLVLEKFGWLYLVSAFSFVVFALYLAFSKFGKIKLGKDTDTPEYPFFTWLAMLFSAGMGIGLLFWGVAEPVSHYTTPPFGPSHTPESALLAMRYSFFHWGLQAWGVYTIVALSIAYFSFRHGQKTLLSTCFRPLLGAKVDGSIGKSIDILAIIATAFGVATSLGLGAMQINSGLNYLVNIPTNITVQISIIIFVTFLFILSATTGLDRGIRILSSLNMKLAFALLTFVFLFGPTFFILDTFTVALGSYLQNFVSMSLRLTPFSGDSWVNTWTIFYWAWWLSWAPFVGTFIARISKGRTIKQFVLGVIIVPSLLCFSWFSVFGGTALYMELFQNAPISQAVQADLSTALFVTLNSLPFGTILSCIAIILLIIFFITSADSAVFVLAMLSSQGTQNPNNKIKLIWGILQSSIAIILLLSGGLQGIQTLTILIGLPLALMLILMCFSLHRALKKEALPITVSLPKHHESLKYNVICKCHKISNNNSKI